MSVIYMLMLVSVTAIRQTVLTKASVEAKMSVIIKKVVFLKYNLFLLLLPLLSLNNELVIGCLLLMLHLQCVVAVCIADIPGESHAG